MRTSAHGGETDSEHAVEAVQTGHADGVVMPAWQFRALVVSWDEPDAASGPARATARIVSRC